MSDVPYDLVYLVHNVTAAHYRQHHQDPDGHRAEAFAETFLEKLFGPAVQADAGRAVASLDVQDLPRVASGGDENYRLAGILQDVLCREIQHWLLTSRIWRYNVERKALAYARAVACAADAGTYMNALQNARSGMRRRLCMTIFLSQKGPRLPLRSDTERSGADGDGDL
jgi:hypothetical protein